MSGDQYIKMKAALQHILEIVIKNPIKSSKGIKVIDNKYSGRPYVDSPIMLTKHCIPTTDKISKENIVEAIQWILQSQGFEGSLEIDSSGGEVRFTGDDHYKNEYTYKKIRIVKILDDVSKQKNAVVVICRTAHDLQAALLSEKKLNEDITPILKEKFPEQVCQNSDSEEEIIEEPEPVNFWGDPNCNTPPEFVINKNDNNDKNDYINENFVDENDTDNVLEKTSLEQLQEGFCNVYTEYKKLLSKKRSLEEKLKKIKLEREEIGLKKQLKEAKEENQNINKCLEKFGIFCRNENSGQNNNNSFRDDYVKKN